MLSIVCDCGMRLSARGKAVVGAPCALAVVGERVVLAQSWNGHIPPMQKSLARETLGSKTVGSKTLIEDFQEQFFFNTYRRRQSSDSPAFRMANCMYE